MSTTEAYEAPGPADARGTGTARAKPQAVGAGSGQRSAGLRGARRRGWTRATQPSELP